MSEQTGACRRHEESPLLFTCGIQSFSHSPRKVSFSRSREQQLILSEKRETENSASESQCERPLAFGSQLSCLWLNEIRTRARQRMVHTVFKHTLGAYLGAPLSGTALPTKRRYFTCTIVLNIFGSHWLGLCPFSRVSFKRRGTSKEHSTWVTLHKTEYTTTSEPMLLDPNLTRTSQGLRADLLVSGGDNQLDTLADLAITCPIPPTFLASTQLRRGKAVKQMFP